MKGNVKIEKSFDKTTEFSKELENGDFKQFMTEEGEYLDSLVSTMKEHAKPGEGFTVTYTVTVKR